MRKLLIAVIGAGESASPQSIENSFQLGEKIAQAGWILLTGGRNVGVMEAANQGAKACGGITVGILPGADTSDVSLAVDIAIVTDLGNARNNVVVLSGDAIVVCDMGLGTLSEVALALKNKKKVIFLAPKPENYDFIAQFAPHDVFKVKTPTAVIELIKQLILLSK